MHCGRYGDCPASAGGLGGCTAEDSGSSYDDCSTESETSLCSDSSDCSYRADADLRKALRDSIAGSSGGLGGQGALDLANWPPAHRNSPVIETLHLYLRTCTDAEGVAAFRASCELREDDDACGGVPSLLLGPYMHSCSDLAGPCDCCGNDGRDDRPCACDCKLPNSGPPTGTLPHQACAPARQGSGAVDGILEELLGTTVLEVLVEPRDPRCHFRSFSF
eukprot:jgi/Botrbrau1/14765/Bobra.0103s0013.1